MKFLIIILSLFIIFGMFCCSNNDGNDGGSIGPGDFPANSDVSEDGLIEQFDYSLHFYNYSYSIPSISIFSTQYVTNSVFKLNDIEIVMNWESDEYCWYWYLDYELPEGVNISPGTNVSYYLNINGNIFSGNMFMPYYPDVYWPEFNIEEDYIFNWSLQEDSNIQLVWNGIEDNDDCNQYHWQLEGNLRNFTISKIYYQDFNEDELCFWLDFYNINYKNFGDCFVFASSDDWYQYPENKRYLYHKTLNKQDKILSIIKKLDLNNR